jgi:hypothetical protein
MVVHIAPSAITFLPAGSVAERHEKIVAVWIGINSHRGFFTAHMKAKAAPAAI